MKAIATVSDAAIKYGMFHFEQKPSETFGAYCTIPTDLVTMWKWSTGSKLSSLFLFHESAAH